jgi:hypothetical protein
MDVLGHMLDDPKHEIDGMHLPKGGCVRDQTFADDTALYLKGSPSNLNKARAVLELFCLASGAKINWGKSAAIWANKEKKEWEWGQEVGLRWIPEGQGVRYLGIQIGFWLPIDANFEKLMFNLKGKMITWGKCNLSLASRILVANQVLLSSMWYLAACWNPNMRMCNQIRGVVRNFIWGGKVSNTRAKVKWDSLTLPLFSGGLGIIDPKAQSEALLAKLLVRGLAPGGEPWKEILRHRADQVHLPVHGKGPSIPDINWLFAAPKLKKLKCSLWKSILGSWLNVRVGLAKSELASHAEVLRQPIFSNPLILNTTGHPLGVSGRNDGRAIANSGCTRIKDLWDQEGRAWKSLQALRLTYHATNRNNKEIIIASIPLNPATYTNRFQAGD